MFSMTPLPGDTAQGANEAPVLPHGERQPVDDTVHRVQDEPSAGACRHQVLRELGGKVDHHPLIADDFHARPTGRVSRPLPGIHTVPESRAVALLDQPARIQPPHHGDRPIAVRRPHPSQQPRYVAVGVHQQPRLAPKALPRSVALDGESTLAARTDNRGTPALRPASPSPKPSSARARGLTTTAPDPARNSGEPR